MTSVLYHISSQLPQETNIDLVNSSRSGVIWYVVNHYAMIGEELVRLLLSDVTITKMA